MKQTLLYLGVLLIGATSISAQTVTPIPSLTVIPAVADGDLMPIHDISSTATNVRKVALSTLKTYFQTGVSGSFDATAQDALTWSDGTNASNLWTFNVSGTDPTLLFGSGAITVGGNFAVTGSFTTGSMTVTGAMNAGSFEFEGATANAFETTLGVVDPTQDNTALLPNATGTISLESTSAGTHASPNTGAETPTWAGATHTIWQGDAATINLPAAAGYANRGIIIYSTAASILTVEPNASEVIVRDGTAQTGGVNFTLSAAAGNYVALISDGVRWVTLGYKGTLAVGS